MSYTFKYGVIHKREWVASKEETLFHKEQAIQRIIELKLNADAVNKSGKLPEGYKCEVFYSLAVDGGDIGDCFKFWDEVNSRLEVAKLTVTSLPEPEMVVPVEEEEDYNPTADEEWLAQQQEAEYYSRFTNDSIDDLDDEDWYPVCPDEE